MGQRRLLAAISSLFCLTTGMSSALPCAPAPPPGVQVRVADETALIVWDDATHTEHFVRKASFLTTGSTFGFLVPTPSAPEFAEASDEVFTTLELETRPEVITKITHEGFRFVPILANASKKADRAVASTAVVEPVRVLNTQIVSGYQAAVLEADNPEALAQWLAKNGYADSPTLRDWLTPYVSTHWKITAFKLAADKVSRAIATSAVRMSFKTDRPFFPYREPSDQRQPSSELPEGDAQHRLLRVYFLGGSRVEGSLGDASHPWSAKVMWSDRYAKEKPILPTGVTLPPNAWLTVLDDDAFPRPGTDDLFFTASSNSSVFHPAPVIQSWTTPLHIPVEPILLAAVGGVFALMRWRKKQKEKETPPPEPSLDKDKPSTADKDRPRPTPSVGTLSAPGAANATDDSTSRRTDTNKEPGKANKLENDDRAGTTTPTSGPSINSRPTQPSLQKPPSSG